MSRPRARFSNNFGDYSKGRRKANKSSSDSSGDEDNQPSRAKRSLRMGSSQFSSSSGAFDFSKSVSTPPTTTFKTITSEFDKKAEEWKAARLQNVAKQWSHIVEEESMNDMSNTMFKRGHVDPDDKLQERGSEQYLNRRLRKRKVDEGPRVSKYESDSDISNDGISDDSLEFVKAKKGIEWRRKLRLEKAGNGAGGGGEVGEMHDALSPEAEPCPRGTGEPSRAGEEEQMEMDTGSSISTAQVTMEEFTMPSEPRAETGDSEMITDVSTDNEKICMDSGQNYEQRQHCRWKRKEALYHWYRNLHGKEFAERLAQHLHEKNLDVLIKAVTILGKEICLRILHKTLKIRRSGGILIKNGNRLRTTGGTFLYLIRNDKRIPTDQRDAVLQAEPSQQLQRNFIPRNTLFQQKTQGTASTSSFAQRICQRIGGNKPRRTGTKIDLESDKFSANFPGVPAQSEIAEKAKTEGRSAVNYSDIDFGFML